jgi:hypothetical protein
MGRALEQRVLTARFQKLLGRLQDGECLTVAALADVFGAERIYPLLLEPVNSRLETPWGTPTYGHPISAAPLIVLIIRRFQCADPACAARWTYTGPDGTEPLDVCECGGRLIPAEPTPAAHPAEGWQLDGH